MPRGRTYGDSRTVQRDTHDFVETRFAGGHADELDSSNTSVHLDDGPPNLRNVNGVIWMYHGDVDKYAISKLSDIPRDDRVYTPQGHIPLSSLMKTLYRAITKAIDEQLFRLNGKYDCANQYIRSGMDSASFDSLPVIEADILCPYYYKASSSVKGVITYSKVIPPNGNDRRVVTIINCKDRGSLQYNVEDRTVVYLGGNHSALDISEGNASDIGGEPQMRNAKYVEYKHNHAMYGPGNDYWREIRISSPFLMTWTAREFGVNVGFAKLRNGHFLYWATNDEPVPGKQLSGLSLKHIPRVPFALPKEAASWPVYNAEARLEDIFEGAWVMRSDRLAQRVDEHDYPEGVLSRLRGGFFARQHRTLQTQVLRIEALVRKALGSLDQYGGKMFGFDERPRGIFECSIQKLASHLRLPVNVLLAFICQFTSSYKYFQGAVSFLLYKESNGRFRITGPVPVGPWMHGVVTETGSGLLYVEMNGKYFSVETVDDVSLLSEYMGEGIVEGSETKLGRWLQMTS